jgi:hypothetical protein
MAVPKIFGAPNPQDTGGAMSSLISAQSQAAGMQLSAIQNAVSQAVQGLQFGAQIRQRKDEQLREIEAQNNLERMRQTFQGDQNRLMREQDERQFKANQRLQWRQLNSENAYRVRDLGMRRLGLDAGIANQERGYGLDVQELNLRKAEAASNERVRAGQLEVQAQQLAEARKNQKLKDQSERYKEWAFQLLQQGGLKQMPDGTVEFDPNAADSLIQRFRSGPRPGDVLEAANAPGAGFGVAQAFEEINQPMNQRASRRVDQDIDATAAAARGGGGDTPLPMAQGPKYVDGDAMAKAIESIPGLSQAGGLGSVVRMADAGKILVDTSTGKLMAVGVNDPLVLQELETLSVRFAQNPTAVFALIGEAAHPGIGPNKGFDAGRVLYGAQGGQPQFTDPGGGMATPPPPPGPQGQVQGQAQGQVQGEQPAPAVQLPEDRFWSDAGVTGPPAETPPGTPPPAAPPRRPQSQFAGLPAGRQQMRAAEGASAPRGGMQRAPEQMRRGAAAPSRATAAQARPSSGLGDVLATGVGGSGAFQTVPLPDRQPPQSQFAGLPAGRQQMRAAEGASAPTDQRQPTTASERAQSAPRDYEKLAQLYRGHGKGLEGLAPEELQGRGRGRDLSRSKLEVMAREGSPDTEEAVTLARSLGHISEAEAEQLRRRSADVARQRDRKRKR